MKVLGLDFETTGLEAQSARVIEIGAVVWDTDKSKPLAVMSELVLPEELTEVPTEIVKVTGIETDDLENFGLEPKKAFQRLNFYLSQCDYVMAHNAEFDKSFYLQEISRHGLDVVEKPWLDSMYDVPYPEELSTRKLGHLAADHGFVNPWSHRALFDVMTMLQIVSKYDFHEVIERSQSPVVTVISHVSFEEKDKAKQMGFRWDPKNKKWFKDYKHCDLMNMDFPFEYSLLEQ
ncbi:MAG: DUF5710 domain-containing protein [Bdellovibrionales bacterium]|nr:DUF5710 domain-containing protein [Bdellovibrionales bacterium]